MNSSTVDDRNVANEKVAGLITGSMDKCERRNRGVVLEIRGGTALWRMVGKNKVGGQINEGKCRTL